MRFRFPIVIIDEDFRSENASGLGIRALAKAIHAFFDQKYEGLPVFSGGAAVHMDQTGRVWGVNNTYVPVSAKSTTPR